MKLLKIGIIQMVVKNLDLKRALNFLSAMTLLFFFNAVNAEEINKQNNITPDRKGLIEQRTDKKLDKISLDNISEFKISELDIRSAFRYNNGYLVFGTYFPVNGRFSKHDSENNYGYRMLWLNSEKSELYSSDGAMDSYIYNPTFYSDKAASRLVVLVQKGSEYFENVDVFYIQNGAIKYIGEVSVYSPNEGIAISSLISVHVVGVNGLELRFNSTPLLIKDSSDEANYLPVNGEHIKYIYDASGFRRLITVK